MQLSAMPNVFVDTGIQISVSTGQKSILKMIGFIGEYQIPQVIASKTIVLVSVKSKSNLGHQNSQSTLSSTDLMAQLNFSRRVLEKNFSIGTSNFLAKTAVRRGSM